MNITDETDIRTVNPPHKCDEDTRVTSSSLLIN